MLAHGVLRMSNQPAHKQQLGMAYGQLEHQFTFDQLVIIARVQCQLGCNQHTTNSWRVAVKEHAIR